MDRLGGWPGPPPTGGTALRPVRGLPIRVATQNARALRRVP